MPAISVVGLLTHCAVSTLKAEVVLSVDHCTYSYLSHRSARPTFTMSVPPDSSSLQVPVGKPDSVLAPGAMTSDTTVSASSSGPVLPASYFVRYSEQITASEALLVANKLLSLSLSLSLQEGPRASSSLLAETIPETQDIPQTPDVPQPSDVSQDFEVIIPRRTTTADPRPYPRLVDPAAVTLPLTPFHTYGLDEASGVHGWITWNAVCIPSIWKVTTSSGTNSPQTGRPKFTHTHARASNISRSRATVDFFASCIEKTRSRCVI